MEYKEKKKGRKEGRRRGRKGRKKRKKKGSEDLWSLTVNVDLR